MTSSTQRSRNAKHTAAGNGLTRLVIFSDDWGRHPSSSQHLAGKLLGRYPTLWVNTIGMRSPGVSRDDLGKAAVRLGHWLRPRGGRVATTTNLRVLAPPMWPGFRTRWQRWANAHLMARAVNAALGRREHAERRVAVTTTPITADLVGRIDVDRWVYYCVDDFSAWPGLDSRVMDDMEREQVAKVDLVLSVSEVLQRRLVDRGRHGPVLTHGVDLAFWAAAGGLERGGRPPGTSPRLLPDEPLPDWWGGLKRPIALFSGLVDRRLDASWCRALLRTPSAVGTLVLGGPQQQPDPALRDLEGIVLPGPSPYDLLPTLLSAADVLVLPYADLPVTRAMQPLKLKECLATGRPVVARALPALREWAAFADVVETVEQFVTAVAERARSGIPAEQVEARRLLVHESWQNKARQFESFILAE